MRMTRICANTANDDTNKNKLKTQKSPPEEDPPLEEKVKITSLRRRRLPALLWRGSSFGGKIQNF